MSTKTPPPSSLREFIRQNRDALDEHIQKNAPGSPKNDSERELWIRNDESLYRWATSEGVRL